MRVLVAEDHKSFRQWLLSVLQRRPEFQVIREVADGLEAVQEAAALQPDLVLLDIGLPKLNGIEAARQILARSPRSRILFVSNETSAVMVQGALLTGASGFVAKIDAARELLVAMDVVSRGEQFVSRSFNEVLLPLRVQTAECASRHEVEFYSDDLCFLDNLTRFIGTALKTGNAAVVVATESHRDGLLLRLQASGLDVGAAIEQGKYVALDAAEALTAFMLNGMPNPARFSELLGNLISNAADTRKKGRVAVFGECVNLLWLQGNAEATIRLERLWNEEIVSRYNVDVLCGYSLRSVQGGGMENPIYEKICAEHSAVYSG